MSACSGCGSATSETQVICEFCGAVLRAVTDPIDEARAVVELGLAWSKIGQSAAKGNPMKSLIASHPMVAGQKAVSFWANAFMPTTLEGLLAAGEQAIGLIRPDAQLMDMQATQMNKVMGPRLETIVELCELKGVGDPRADALKVVARRKLKDLSAGKFRAWRNYVLLFVGFFVLMGGALFFLEK